MAFVQLLITGDATTEVEAEATLVLAGDVSITGSGKFLEVKELRAETPTEITLDTNGDTIVTQMFHTIDTFSDAASDTIVGLVGGNDGQLLILHPADDARTIIVGHNGSPGATDNLVLADDANFTMDRIEDSIMFIYDVALDSNGAWMELSRSIGGVAVLTANAPSSVSTTGNVAVGSGTEAAKDDHIHDLGSGSIEDTNLFASGIVDQAALGANSVGNSEIRNADTDIAFLQIIITPQSNGQGTTTGTIYYDTEDARLYVFQA